MLHVVNKKSGFSPAEAESLRLRGHDDCSKTGQSGQSARRGSLLSSSRSGYIGEKLAPDGNRGIAREPNSAPGAEESPIFIGAGRRGHILEHLSGVNPPQYTRLPIARRGPRRRFRSIAQLRHLGIRPSRKRNFQKANIHFLPTLIAPSHGLLRIGVCRVVG